MKKALITGVAGQDGSYLAELLISKGYEVHGVIRSEGDRNSEYLWRIKHILNTIHIHIVDVSNYESVKELIKKIKPDEIYHLATKHDLSNSLENYLSITRTNLDSTYFLLSSIKEFNPNSKLFFASSSRIFGNPLVSPQNEDTPKLTNSLYGVSKLAASELIRMYREKEGIFACSGILFTHESPRRDLGFLSHKVTLGAVKIKLGLESVLGIGNLEAKRDWGYAGDYVEGMWLMLQNSKPEDFVIGTGEVHSVQELVELAFGELSLDWKKYVIIDPKFVRQLENVEVGADISKIKKELGWLPKTSFNDLVREMVRADLDSFKKNDSK
jgi:GDPmannose 4,6-dehydratase